MGVGSLAGVDVAIGEGLGSCEDSGTAVGVVAAAVGIAGAGEVVGVAVAGIFGIGDGVGVGDTSVGVVAARSGIGLGVGSIVGSGASASAFECAFVEDVFSNALALDFVFGASLVFASDADAVGAGSMTSVGFGSDGELHELSTSFSTTTVTTVDWLLMTVSPSFVMTVSPTVDDVLDVLILTRYPAPAMAVTATAATPAQVNFCLFIQHFIPFRLTYKFHGKCLVCMGITHLLCP